MPVAPKRRARQASSGVSVFARTSRRRVVGPFQGVGDVRSGQWAPLAVLDIARDVGPYRGQRAPAHGACGARRLLCFCYPDAVRGHEGAICGARHGVAAGGAEQSGWAAGHRRGPSGPTDGAAPVRGGRRLASDEC